MQHGIIDKQEARAAGILYVTPDRKALFLRRAGGGDFNGYWGFPGGHVEDGESPEAAAIREANEECVMAPGGALTRLGTYNGFVTHRQDIAAPFDPKLNHEHTASVWAPLNDPPEPLHPGAKVMLGRLRNGPLGFGDAIKALRKFSPDEARDEHGRWSQTGTAEFKSWFGASKITGKDGAPLRVYHGTGADFTVFSRKFGGSSTEAGDAKRGFFFAQSPKAADFFAEYAARYKPEREGANVIPAYLRMENPLVIDYGHGGATITGDEITSRIKEARREGNDGVVFMHARDPSVDTNIFFVFKPTQIKSAVGNSGAFDLKNPDFGKYSPDQARDNDGRWTSTGAALSPETNEAAIRIANKLLPGGYEASANAPNTYADLVKHYSETGKMTVWSGGSDKTIFGDPKANYAFRAWHDLAHLRGMHNFTPEGEQGALNEMLKDVRDEYGTGEKAEHIGKMLDEEILGQLRYNELHGGEFPVDQRSFAEAYLRDPEAAIHQTFKADGSAHHWGRLRDVGQPKEPRSALAIKVAAQLQRDRVRLRKYDPEQPRDEHGRWASVAFASPSIEDQPHLHAAISQLSQPRHQLFMRAGREVDGALGLHGRQSDVVGAWKDGAENSTMTESPTATLEQMRVSASMKGWLGQQKQVLVFARDPEGPAALYDMTVPGAAPDVHASLLKAGIPFHTLQDAGSGTRVLVVDTDGTLGHKVGNFAVDNGTVAERTYGKAEFIGDQEGTGDDAEQRGRARQAYERVIEASSASRYQGRSVGSVWRGLHNRWRSQLESIKRAGLTFGDAVAALKRLVV